MRHALVAILAFVLPGCVGPLAAPDTFDDMWRRAEALHVPDDFVLVSRETDGSRDTFAAGSDPEVTLVYAAPWDDGNLCARIRKLAGRDRSGRPGTRANPSKVAVTTRLASGPAGERGRSTSGLTSSS
jgi:hypothetical protein